jgi:hypothetical protein
MRRSPLFALLVSACTVFGLVSTAGVAVAAPATAAFRKVQDWGSGFTAEYKITNSSSAALTGWKVEFDLPNGTAPGSYWDADLTTTGNHHTFINRGWNGAVAVGASVVFGFNGTTTGGFTEPLNCKLNGSPCGGGPADVTPPSTPSGLKSTGKTSTSVSLTWNASTDNTGVVAYDVYRAGTVATSSTSTSASVGGLTASTAYQFTVKARDAAGNTSAASAAVAVTTDAGTGPPPVWHPNYLAVGTVHEPFDGSEQFLDKVQSRFPAGKKIDYGYLYLNGGSQINEWHARTERLAGKSKARGMTPVFVVYAVGGNTDSSTQVWNSLQSTSYLGQVFAGVRDVAKTATTIMGNDRIGYVVEPDTLGYVLQQFAGQYGNDPNRIPAGTSGVYDSGVLTRGVDPDFPNTLAGFVKAMNHVLRKYTPNTFLGWQLNLWGAAGAPGNGVIHSTEAWGFETGKQRLQDNARANASFARDAGVAVGADFVSIDKYGLDAMCAESSLASDPARATWFWNADLWNNYLLYAKTLKDTLALPVVLWQVPVGHINGSKQTSPTEYNSSGRFPDFPNSVQQCEDSASTYLFGDSFTATGNRLAYFSRNDWHDPKVTVSGNTVTWGSHFAEAANAGVVAILMGAGVGTATRGVPQPGNLTNFPVSAPTDNYYWITRVQQYYANPTSLPAG